MSAPAVTAVIEETCRQQGADLHWVAPLPDDWQLGLAGVMQRHNAAVARAALQALAPLGWTVDENAIRRGFAEARWPGRLQSARWQNHPLLLDGAHNPRAGNLRVEQRDAAMRDGLVQLQHRRGYVPELVLRLGLLLGVVQ